MQASARQQEAIAQVIAARHPPDVSNRPTADTSASSCVLLGIPIARVLTDPRHSNGRFTENTATTARNENDRYVRCAATNLARCRNELTAPPSNSVAYKQRDCYPDNARLARKRRNFFGALKNAAAPGRGATGGRVVDAVSARETKTARELAYATRMIVSENRCPFFGIMRARTAGARRAPAGRSAAAVRR
jgi:hypothetical protein